MPPPHALLSSPLHRIPTLWSLVRPLLRAARTAPLPPPHRDALANHVRAHFRLHRNLGSVDRVRRKLVDAQQLLHQLDSASHSATHLDRLRALASHLVLRQPAPPAPSSSSSSPRRRPRKPFLSPSILLSTPFHPPLPRLRPQLLGTSMTIHRRRRASQNRYDVVERARELVALARDEDEFLRRLVVGVGVRREAGTAAGSSREGWGTEWSRWLGEARAKEAREQARNALVVPPELQHQAREAARERERRRIERATAAVVEAARRGRQGENEQ